MQVIIFFEEQEKVSDLLRLVKTGFSHDNIFFAPNQAATHDALMLIARKTHSTPRHIVLDINQPTFGILPDKVLENFKKFGLDHAQSAPVDF
jgi:hypothetical protein